MVHISNKTLSVLTEAGWNEGRKIDISEGEELLRSKGYQIFDKLITFLSEFGKLNLKFRDGIGAELLVSFDIERALSKSQLYLNDLVQEDYPRAINCKTLTIVGKINRETHLAMNEEGIIYSLYDGYILEVGKGIEAIDNLIANSYKDLKQIPMPDWWGE